MGKNTAPVTEMKVSHGKGKDGAPSVKSSIIEGPTGKMVNVPHASADRGKGKGK